MDLRPLSVRRVFKGEMIWMASDSFYQKFMLSSPEGIENFIKALEECGKVPESPRAVRHKGDSSEIIARILKRYGLK